MYFNHNLAQQVSSQKHLGTDLNTKLNFQGHLDDIMSKKIAKTIGLLRKLPVVLPCLSLITMYKAFIGPHHDYGDIVYDQAYKESFHQKLESAKYNAAIAIASTFRILQKLYQELGLESLKTTMLVQKTLLLFSDI